MTKPTVISLFTGAGGLDLGAHAAGLRTAVAVEMDPLCCRTLRANKNRWRPREIIEAPIERTSSADILKAARLKKGEADLLIGGPPCQPFSKSGYWHRGDSQRLEDPRASTLSEYIRVLRDTKPKAFLLENVSGLAFTGKEEGLLFIKREAEMLGYTVCAQVLNAADFGVPQLRERIFVVGSRSGGAFQFPSPRFSSRDDVLCVSNDVAEPHRTAWDALGDLGEPPDIDETVVRGKWGGLLPSIPEGNNYLFHTDRGGGEKIFGWRRRFWSFLLKLAKDRPSWTLTATPGPSTGPFHWDNRRLARRELARLQTLPDDYVIEGTLAEVQRQVGNAVPSLLAEVLVREIRQQVLGHRIRAETRLAIPRREPGPDPTPPAAVPLDYGPYIGEHRPHPGTGRGPGAQRRRDSV